VAQSSQSGDLSENHTEPLVLWRMVAAAALSRTVAARIATRMLQTAMLSSLGLSYRSRFFGPDLGI